MTKNLHLLTDFKSWRWNDSRYVSFYFYHLIYPFFICNPNTKRLCYVYVFLFFNHLLFHRYTSSVIPIGAMFAMTLWLGNTAYLYISVAFAHMLKAVSKYISLYTIHYHAKRRKYPCVTESNTLCSASSCVHSRGSSRTRSDEHPNASDNVCDKFWSFGSFLWWNQH